jgi:L-alanine-DL-glutamate epimerase-like enolase superfamily enzyme
MKIKGARLWKITLHTREPFKIAFETLDECHGVLLELFTDEGLVGFGEASPARRITGETAETCASVLEQVLLPAVYDCNPLDLPEIHARMDASILGNPSAKAAVDMACYDLLGKACSKPLAMVLGGSLRPLATDHTLSIKPPQQQAETAEALVRQGFRILKVKLGDGGKEDVERVKAIRQRVGPDVVLRVDANQGWSLREALYVLEHIAPYRIELAEQPLFWRDWKGMSMLCRRSPIPIAADESVHSPQDALKAVEQGICNIINIKLMKCGGIYRALQIASIAETAGLSCMIGGMIAESRLAVSAAAHFASARPVVQYLDLDADILLRDELVEKGGIGLQEGNRILPNLPGIGVEKFFSSHLTPLHNPRHAERV